MYTWLSGQFPDAFVSADLARQAQQMVAGKIGEALLRPLAVDDGEDDETAMLAEIFKSVEGSGGFPVVDVD